MGKLYRSAQGKMVDIDKLRLTNESAIAVGNAKVNARGDKLGPGGVIVQPRNQAMDQQYKRMHTPMMNPQAMPEADPTPTIDPALFEEGRDFDAGPTVESAETAGTPEAPKQQLRGSLADSVAKSVTVSQEAPNTTKPLGPQRI